MFVARHDFVVHIVITVMPTWQLSNYYRCDATHRTWYGRIHQGSKKPPRTRLPRRPNFVQVFSVRNLILVTLQTHRAIGWRSDFWKISGSTWYTLWYPLSSLITRFVELITDYHLVEVSYSFWTVTTTRPKKHKTKMQLSVGAQFSRYRLSADIVRKHRVDINIKSSTRNFALCTQSVLMRYEMILTYLLHGAESFLSSLLACS